MDIRLYKNCILNDSYSEVFDCAHNTPSTSTNYHEEYLNKLSAKGDYRDFQIENTYLTLRGTLSFEVTASYLTYDDFLSYNYMQIDDDVTLITKYFFIDHIELINGICVINYSEDIWSNYSSKMNFRMGVLNRAKLLDYPLKNKTNFNIPFYELPLNYKTNNKIEYTNVFDKNNISLPNKQFYIIFKTQEYKLGEVGEETFRVPYMRLFYKKEGAIYKSTFSISEALLNINSVIINSANHVLHQNITDVPKEYGYEITATYIIPEEMFELIKDNIGIFINTVSSYNIKDKKSSSKSDYNLATLGAFTSNDLILLNKTTLAGNIENFKKFAVGTFNTPIDLIHNGTDINIELYGISTLISFDLFLNVQNKIINITKDFEITYPIKSNTLDVTQLNNISKEIRNISLDNQRKIGQNEVAKKGIDVTSGLISMARGIGSYNGDLAISSALSVAKSGLDIDSGIVRLEEIENQRDLVNAKAYTSSSSIITMNSNILTIENGINWFYITPDNEREVNDFINENGYKVNEIINFDIFKDTLISNESYNILKFDYIRMNGEFPQDIMSALKSILTSGFKIWYNYEL